MLKSILTILFFLLILNNAKAQENSKFIDISKTTNFIDSLLIDRDLNNWSIRVFGSFKPQQFIINSGDDKYTYRPNNPYGIGFGVGTKKIKIDLGLNLKATVKNPTKRFDMLWSFFKQNHLIEFYYMNYKGFDVQAGSLGETIFREDVKCLSTSISYMYMFQESRYSIAAVKSGLTTADKSVFSFGLGGFILHSNQSASEPFIPNDPDSVEKFKGTAMGVRLGFSSLIVLPKNFFLSFNVSPGIGLMSKKVYSDNSEFKPKKPIVSQLGLSMILGYNAEQYYLNLSVSNGYYQTDFNFGDQVVFGYLNAKLVYGYKLKGKIKKNWKK